MTQLNQIYKCNTCGNIIEILHAGKEEMICCGQPMELLTEKTKTDEGNEKHVPVIEKIEEGKRIRIKVGAVEHPMKDEHYIEWIELENKDKEKICKKSLKPGEKPEAKSCAKIEDIKARAYCNVHGLWKSS
ncbi:MAG TPA: desulfoferrodoxin [Candidatus Pacearchaeota archaeon]|nr:desulfoferrodoxin [Candidatus Pacearchaeota archaeon]